ncbi:Major facilitator superfamily domain, general substrate transporter [Plasmopara halstedii]|uniref:Major facilitator superfamily domain, general substrate transporter n=1 Tax=Plasmopara halstedii TaxID=4781 RepID=A0A0P1ABE2_PLAHL|nr:Major facilitator superfamily domain, general substrate transporter [Plasmopara halstedii]CEG38148.1 Major facilitator superfamily domain, general substrate transporter [Plasmopara halstedii]|eukprot:XP_024574517.1 Major facilitator superfamily domain, general substrate transporter [Plasmopara halstedii]
MADFSADRLLSSADGIRGRNKKSDGTTTTESGNAGSFDEVQDVLTSLPAADNDVCLVSIAPEKEKKSAKLIASMSNVQKIHHWWKSMRLQFGDGLLLQIFFVYFTQGLRSTLCSLGTSYYLNETLALPPARSEVLRATAAIPWIIKPLYGILSDSVPIFGTRRKSYLLIFSAISAIAYFALSIPDLITTYDNALIALVVASLGIAFCDVVIDGKVVEAARSEREDMAGNLQTLSWLSLSIGSVLGSMVSGIALNTFGPLGVFLLTAMGPLFVVLISIKIPEEKYSSQENLGFCQNVRDQCQALASVVVDPICWRPMLWIFLSNALPPSVNEAMFTFKTAELGFSKSFLGLISTIGSFTLLGTTALYNAYFRSTPFRRLFFRIQLASACVSFAEFVLVSRFNVLFGISDQFFIFGDEILSDVVARLKHMPSLVLCAKICPPASYGGSWLCNYLEISKTNFAGLATAVTIRSVAKLAPLFLLSMVPETINVSRSSLASSKLNHLDQSGDSNDKAANVEEQV